MKKIAIILGCCALFLGACAGSDSRVLGTTESQVALRNIQSRSFETSDRALVMRATISTLQDLGFMIDKADEALGTISATQFSGGNTKMTVSVRVADDATIVRANAQRGLYAIEDAKPYQNFFNALSQSLFLAENNVN